MDRLIADLRFAFRGMLRRPAFTLVVVLTLALGIGANTAIFSVVNGVLLSPLPYASPEKLIVLTGKNQAKNLTQQPLAYLNIVDWRAQNSVFENLAAVRGESLSLTSGSEPERVAGLRTSVDILPLLGLRPALGRDFRADEDQPGSAQVALISHGFWQRHGADPKVLGEKLTLDGKPYTIIGVLPPGLKQPGLTMASVPATGADVWIPLVPAANEQNRNFANMRAIARLKPSVTVSQAQAEMDTLALRLEKQYPEINANLGLELTSLHENLTGRVRRALWILLAVVGCVLLIACANVANLLLARASTRQTEMAVRTSLGASRGTLIRQLLTECVLLSVAGSGLGLLFAYQAISLVSRINPQSIPRLEEVTINSTVLAFTLLLAIVTGIIFGLAPALLPSGVELTEVLKEGKKGSGRSGGNRRLLGGLVVAEIAIALVLLTGAGLMMRSFRAVTDLDPGFDLTNVLTFTVPLPQATYRDQQQQLDFFNRTLARLKTIPGVESAAGTFRVPITGFATVIFTAQGKPVPFGSEPSADYRTVTPAYFSTMGMRLQSGRAFTDADVAASPDVVVVNEELAHRYWPNEDAVGKRLQVAAERTRWREVVGVVRNAKLSGLEAPTDPAIYVPFAQNTWPNALRISAIVVRTKVEPRSLITSIRNELRQVDPSLPITQPRTMEEIASDSLSSRRFNTGLLAAFSVIAGLLAVVGIYGVMSYNVTERTHELGIRLALGADRSEIVRMVTVEGGKLAVLGILIGTIAALISTRLMASLLFGVGATDPATFILIGAMLSTATVLASYIPARRAASTDPIIALRAE